MRIPILLLLACTACVSNKPAGISAAQFVEETLGLKSGAELFGTPLDRFSNAEAASPEGAMVHSDAGLEWYKTAESVVYERDHPGRILRYGFADRRLAAVRVFSGIALNPDKEQAARVSESLSRFLSDFKKLPGQGMTREDKSLRVQYESFCNPEENIFAVIAITPSSQTH